MKILLLGATGFVGRHLAAALRGVPGLTLLSPPRSELDVTDSAAAVEWLDRAAPQVVINAAAGTGIGSVETRQAQVREINTLAPARWAAACAARGVQLVHFSTDQVFPGDRDTPYREDDPTGAVSTYGKTKEEGEEAVRAHPGHLVIRTSFVFGVGGANFMSRLPFLLMSEEKLTIVEDLRGSCTAVGFLADTTVDLVRRGAAGLWNVANSGDATWPEFADECLAALRSAGHHPRCQRVTLVSAESLRDKLGPRAPYSVLDTGKLAKLNGQAPRHWKEEVPGFVARCMESL